MCPWILSLSDMSQIHISSSWSKHGAWNLYILLTKPVAIASIFYSHYNTFTAIHSEVKG